MRKRRKKGPAKFEDGKPDWFDGGHVWEEYRAVAIHYELTEVSAMYAFHASRGRTAAETAKLTGRSIDAVYKGWGVVRVAFGVKRTRHLVKRIPAETKAYREGRLRKHPRKR